jgi:hypothetical protein
VIKFLVAICREEILNLTDDVGRTALHLAANGKNLFLTLSYLPEVNCDIGSFKISWRLKIFIKKNLEICIAVLV